MIKCTNFKVFTLTWYFSVTCSCVYIYSMQNNPLGYTLYEGKYLICLVCFLIKKKWWLEHSRSLFVQPLVTVSPYCSHRHGSRYWEYNSNHTKFPAFIELCEFQRWLAPNRFSIICQLLLLLLSLSVLFVTFTSADSQI